MHLRGRGRRPHAEPARRLAKALLRGTAAEAKRATGKRSLAGLDDSAWEGVKALVMAVGAVLQATGCAAFAARLRGTGDMLLVEAKSYDAWWGVGMTTEAAKKTPVEARAMAWGRNEHGSALMLARAALAAGDSAG